MLTFLNTAETVDEQSPRSSPPWVWVGFLFALAFLVLETVYVFMDLEEKALMAILTLIVLAGWIYWLVCVYRLHKILAELTGNRYPITPSEAAGRHIIPFYNFVWIFRWPAELSNYLNSRGRVSMVSGYLIGSAFLGALLLRFFDGAIGMAFLFGITMYVAVKLNRHVELVKGASPENLPPLPDPNMFDDPQQTLVGDAQGMLEEKSGRI
jgi:NADH:ubiquinone oxidoreductase subunit 6 (subunit J)